MLLAGSIISRYYTSQRYRVYNDHTYFALIRIMYRYLIKTAPSVLCAGLLWFLVCLLLGFVSTGMHRRKEHTFIGASKNSMFRNHLPPPLIRARHRVLYHYSKYIIVDK